MISINYESVEVQIAKLRGVASDCEQAQNMINSTVSKISNGWEGASADNFSDAMMAQNKKVQSLTADINTVAATIQKIVNEFKAADEKAKQAIENS